MKYQKYTLNSKKDLDALMNRIGDARFVLLGEATHGTHEFYSWRASISKRLIEEKGFNFISVEGDWPDCYKINRFVKGLETDKNAQSILSTFVRWPTWMWGNWEIVSLANWMKEYNDRLPDNSRKVGFYGLDVYSLWESLDVIQKYLNENDPQTAKICKKAVDCFSSYNRDEHAYAMRSLSSPCRDEVTRLLSEVRKKSPQYQYDPEDSLNMEQNSWVAVEAEKYYRNMVSFDDQTWNIRDKHMMDTLKRLVQFHGPESKAIVWEHNTHIGDARYTDMAQAGMFNIGQLCREDYGKEQTVIVGFSTYSGTVIAGKSWGAQMQEMIVPEGRKGSLEEQLHSDSEENKLLIFDKTDTWKKSIPHRAIGVVYRPEREAGNYVPSVVNKRYDAMVYIDRSKALHPLKIRADSEHLIPEGYPFNV